MIPRINELRQKGRLVGRLGDEDVYALDGRWYRVDEYTATDGRTYPIVLALDPWEYEVVERGPCLGLPTPGGDPGRRVAPPAFTARQGVL